jgi:hypothetical protein
MKRELPDLLANRGQLPVVNESQPLEQRQGASQGGFAGRLEPFELSRIATPRDDIQDGCGQIHSMNVWLAVGA